VRLFKAFIHLQATHYIDFCIANLLHTVNALDKPLEVIYMYIYYFLLNSLLKYEGEKGGYEECVGRGSGEECEAAAGDRSGIPGARV
jgi:hypothetical protein